MYDVFARINGAWDRVATRVSRAEADATVQGFDAIACDVLMHERRQPSMADICEE